MKLHRLLQSIAPQVVRADMRADSLQPKIVQLLAKFLGLSTVFVVARKLDARKSHLRHPREGIIKVFPAIASN